MKFLSASFALLFAGIALAASDEEPAPFVEGEIPDELFDPTALFVGHCWDPLRTRGQPERPVTGMLWSTLTEEMRTQFNVPDDPEVEAWTKVEWETGTLILMQFHQHIVQPEDSALKLLNQRCRITHIGAEPKSGTVLRELKKLHHASPAPGREVSGADRLTRAPTDWRIWCWSGTLAREATLWRLGRLPVGRTRRWREPECSEPVQPDFYESRQYVESRLITSGSDRTVNIIEVERTTRVDDLLELGR